MKYTKGTWRTFRLPEGWRIEAINGEQIAFSIPSEANARLIAAAPEMYEALKATQEGTGDWRAMVDLALVKAEVK